MQAMARRTVVIAVLAMSLVTSFVTTPATATTTIQPGDFVRIGDSGCTLNFVYDRVGGPTATYIGVAGHCASGVGDDAYLDTGELFGDVVAIGDAESEATDWALIEVRGEFLPRVRAGVRGHPATPTGVADWRQTQALDQVQLSGYGLGFQLSGATRQERPAVLTFDDAEVYAVAGPLIYGDSGGPVVHAPTGRALGIVSRLCLGTCTEIGPTVAGVMAKAAAAGFSLRLRTA